MPSKASNAELGSGTAPAAIARPGVVSYAQPRAVIDVWMPVALPNVPPFHSSLIQPK